MSRVRIQVEVAGRWRLALDTRTAAARYGITESALRSTLTQLRAAAAKPDATDKQQAAAELLARITHPVDGKKVVYEQSGLDEIMNSRPGRGVHLRGQRSTNSE